MEEGREGGMDGGRCFVEKEKGRGE